MTDPQEDWRTCLRFKVPTGDIEVEKVIEVRLKVYFYAAIPDGTSSQDILDELSEDLWGLLHSYVSNIVSALAMYNEIPVPFVIPVTFIKGPEGSWYPLPFMVPGSEALISTLGQIEEVRRELLQSLAFMSDGLEIPEFPLVPVKEEEIEFAKFDNPTAMQEIFKLARERSIRYSDADSIARIMAELGYFLSPCCRDSTCPYVQSLERYWREQGFVPGSFIAG